jgi:hypothetical protein
VEPEDQSAVERLARYIMRPPISLERRTSPPGLIGGGIRNYRIHTENVIASACVATVTEIQSRNQGSIAIIET